MSFTGGNKPSGELLHRKGTLVAPFLFLTNTLLKNNSYDIIFTVKGVGLKTP